VASISTSLSIIALCRAPSTCHSDGKGLSLLKVKGFSLEFDSCELYRSYIIAQGQADFSSDVLKNLSKMPSYQIVLIAALLAIINGYTS